MSFLSRLSARAGPSVSAAPLLMPKGFAAKYAGPVYREEAPAEEEEQVASKRVMRVRAVRRQETEAPDQGEEEMSRAPSAGAIGEQPEEETMQPLRRAGAEAAPSEEEEEVQAIRRAEAAPEGEEEEAVQAARFVRRAEEVPLDDTEKPLRQPFQSDLEPGATPPHPDLANEEEPSDLQALRRDVVPQSPPPGRSERPGHVIDGGEGQEPAAPYGPGYGDRFSQSGAAATFQARDGQLFEPRRAASTGADRPQVIIDQLDVLIHEQAPSPRAAARPATDQGRMLRARYLRRL